MSSPAFNVRTSNGACYFCTSPFVVGERAFYLTAKALRDTPERPLTPNEERQARTFGREVAAARRARTALPTAPAWLWERMVHPACASRAGFPSPRGETEAQRGTRTTGVAHGVSVTPVATATVATGGTPVAIPAPVAPTPVDAGFAAALVAGGSLAPAIDTSALPTGNRAYVEAVRNDPDVRAERDRALAERARAVAERNRVARGETVAPAPVAAPGVRILDLSPETPAQPLPADLSDVSHVVERFRRLDLD